jgi:hypothetical protein
MSACFVRSEAFFLSDILGFGLKRRRWYLAGKMVLN